MRKLLAVAALAAVALSACGGGKSSPSAAPGAPGAISPTGGSKGGNAFSSLVAKSTTATYKVTYTTESGTLTISQEGKRYSFVNGDSATYVAADGTAASCTGSGSSATCIALPSGAAIKSGLSAAFGSIASLFVNEAGAGIPGLTSVSRTSSEKIAGRSAECATIDASTLGVLGAALGKGSYSVCVDKQTGVMLSSKATNGTGTVTQITATAFSTPTDADLTPPVTPQTTPTIPGGITIPSIPGVTPPSS